MHTTISYLRLFSLLRLHTRRYIFIEFNTVEEAERARNYMEGHAFDVKHRFQVNLLSDFETYADMDETYEEPEPEEFEPRVRIHHIRVVLFLTLFS